MSPALGRGLQGRNAGQKLGRQGLWRVACMEPPAPLWPGAGQGQPQLPSPGPSPEKALSSHESENSGGLSVPQAQLSSTALHMPREALLKLFEAAAKSSYPQCLGGGG